MRGCECKILGSSYLRGWMSKFKEDKGGRNISDTSNKNTKKTKQTKKKQPP